MLFIYKYICLLRYYAIAEPKFICSFVFKILLDKKTCLKDKRNIIIIECDIILYVCKSKNVSSGINVSRTKQDKVDNSVNLLRHRCRICQEHKLLYEVGQDRCRWCFSKNPHGEVCKIVKDLGKWDLCCQGILGHWLITLWKN